MTEMQSALAPRDGLMSAARIEALLDSAVYMTVQMMAAARCSLMLLAPEGNWLTIKKARGLAKGVVSETRLPVGEGVAGWVALHRASVLAADRRAHPHLARRHRSTYATDSFISAPILANGEPAGVLNVADKRDGTPFEQRDLLLVEQIAGFVGELLDVQCTLEDLGQNTFVDSLTGLGNNRYFHVRLFEELARAERYRHEVALLFVAVERLAGGEHRGYKAGNDILRLVSRAINSTIRQSDVAFRYSVDRFAILLSQGHHVNGASVAERILQTLQLQETQCANGQSTGASVSFGISCYPSLALDGEQLISQAMAALYSAQVEGQGVVVWQEPTSVIVAAQRAGIPYLVAPAELVNRDNARLLALDLACRHWFVPVGQERGKITVAVADPADDSLLKLIARSTGLMVHCVVSSRAEIGTALRRMSALLHKRASAKISLRETENGGREATVALSPIGAKQDLGRLMRDITDACRVPRATVEYVDAHLLVIATDAEGEGLILSRLPSVDGLLVEEVLGASPACNACPNPGRALR